ncbi:MAG: hypothetical protein WDA16_09575 [Candidatus Thermoplasmatota archaeon]
MPARASYGEVPLMAAMRERVTPRSGRSHKKLKMTTMQARHGPARPLVRRWLASFLIEMILK